MTVSSAWLQNHLPPNYDADHNYRTFVCGSCGNEITVPICCGNRFCHVCNKGKQARARKKLALFFAQTKPKHGYRWRFITLTVPSVCDAHEGVKNIQSAFRKFRQSQLWKLNVEGGISVIEITGKPGRWHVHLHIVVSSNYIPQKQLSKTWFRFSTGPIVWISNARPSSLATYLTKYLSKSAVASADVWEVSRALKGQRLFTAIGVFYGSLKGLPSVKPSCHICGKSNWMLPEGIGFSRGYGILETFNSDEVAIQAPF
jgi:hypothetical protein